MILRWMDERVLGLYATIPILHIAQGERETEGLITPTSSYTIICDCNSVKSGGPTSNSEHNPHHFHN